MNILYACYWGINDGLTRSTVIPNLQILESFDAVSQIVLCTIERDTNEKSDYPQLPAKVEYNPFKSGTSLRFKLKDFLILPNAILGLCLEKKIDYVIANGTLAGTLCLKSARKTGKPLVNEFFEPHADYMLDSKVWNRFDLRYLFLKRAEIRLRTEAFALITVTVNYLKKLNQEGYHKKSYLAPASVDMEKFKYNSEKGRAVRERIGTKDDNVVGVCVGKFGDIYWDMQESAELFSKVMKILGPVFFLIILTPENSATTELSKFLIQTGFPKSRFLIKSVSHEEVPDYLSASDFAFTLVKSTPNRKYCAPVKNGEYWANGLPILIPPGIGDDSEIIRKMQTGSVISGENMEAIKDSLDEIKQIISNASHREQISKLATKYRSIQNVEEIYRKLLFAG